jgi:glucokinase
MTDVTLALDVGGTKIAAGLVDGHGRVLHSARAPTPDGDAEAVWAATERLVAGALRRAGGVVRGVGIGSAGPIDLPTGTVSPINIPQWRAFPLRERVAAAVPHGVPVRLAGDGLCLTLGEHWRGAGRGAAFLLGMVVSTGVGGGLVLGGTPYHGRTGNAGHVGHVVVDLDGPPCACGGRGCVETVAAGPRMTAWAREHGWDPGPAAAADARQLAAAAAAGHPVALRAFHRAATALAASVASVAAACDLDLVVIGGGVARCGPLLFDPLRAALRRYAALRHLDGLRVVPAELTADAGLIGAAALASAAAAP